MSTLCYYVLEGVRVTDLPYQPTLTIFICLLPSFGIPRGLLAPLSGLKLLALCVCCVGLFASPSPSPSPPAPSPSAPASFLPVSYLLGGAIASAPVIRKSEALGSVIIFTILTGVWGLAQIQMDKPLWVTAILIGLRTSIWVCVAITVVCFWSVLQGFARSLACGSQSVERFLGWGLLTGSCLVCVTVMCGDAFTSVPLYKITQNVAIFSSNLLGGLPAVPLGILAFRERSWRLGLQTGVVAIVFGAGIIYQSVM